MSMEPVKPTGWGHLLPLALPATALLAWACTPPADAPAPWTPLDAAIADGRVWADDGTGHVVRFTDQGRELFHFLPARGDGAPAFCIRDTGVVPEYALYRIAPGGDALELHYYDYRDRPELLQAPQWFERRDALPAACATPSGERAAGTELYRLVAATFDHFYAFLELRDDEWEGRKQRLAAVLAGASGEVAGASEERAGASGEVAGTSGEDDEVGDVGTLDDDAVFDALVELLAPLNDGHVNLTGAGRSFGAGRPALRARLGELWAASGSTGTEDAFVSAWHRGVLASVYEMVDAGSLRAGSDGAVEWGTMRDGAVGYVRVNRFTSFTDFDAPRPVQYDTLDATMRRVVRDLAGTERLVVDVAMNGGGSDAAAQLVASHFADRERDVLTYEADRTPPRTLGIAPAGSGETRPVTLLTSEVTASAAESFVLMMRAFPHVTQVGGRTRGILSSLLPKPFPNGFRATLSYQRVLDADGQLFEAVGISPHREVDLFPDGDVHGTFARVLAEIAADR